MKVSDKVMCVAPISPRARFEPCPQMGQVYVVREADGQGEDARLRLIGIQGTAREGEEAWLAAGSFRLLADHQKAAPEDRLPAPKPEMRTIPLIRDVKWLTPEDQHALFGAVDQSMKFLAVTLDTVRECLARGGWRDPDSHTLACLMDTWSDRRAAMDEDTAKKEGRTFFSSRPQVGATVKVTYAGGALPVRVAWKYRGGWHDCLYRTDVVCRAFDGRYFLVRETEPHCFVPPPHAKWLRGLVRVKRITRNAALLFALRDGFFPFAQDMARATSLARQEGGGQK